MKKLPAFLFVAALVVASLLPLSRAGAVSYEPTYTCLYRDISGHCINYQTNIQNVTSYRADRPYGNRTNASLTYPFRDMFNAYNVNRSTWDNRTSNEYNFPKSYLRFESEYDDNDYFDDGDDLIRTYYDNNDFQYRNYRMQYGNDWQDDYGYRGINGNGTYNYEHTKITCTGYSCGR